MNHEDQIAAKQAYLRKHISAEKYEDFAEFCENIAGSIDIETWTLEYVHELVDRFKRSEADKAKNSKKTGAFHLYQTGSEDQLKDVANKIKKEKEHHIQKQEHNEHKIDHKNNQLQAKSNKEEKTAMDVLDSIFKNQPAPSEYETKKYDKAFFESCNFWKAPEDKEKTTTHIKAVADPSKFASNAFPLQPENFEKMFQTGIALPTPKQPPKQATPKKEEKPIFVEIPIEDDPPQQQLPPIPKPVPAASSQETKKNEIKLVSVKDIKGPKQSKLPYEGEVLIRESFKDTVACFKSFERAALSSKDLKVEITSHEIIARSFFSSDYPMFHLRVLPANIICKRNLEDFQKLRRNLESVYPGVRLPFLEKLGWLESETDLEYIERQKKYLCYFLEDVLHNEELKNSRILEDFLTLKDHKQMKRKFEEYDKIRKITSIEELCLLEGEVKVEISEANRQYNEHLQAFLTKLKLFWANEERVLTQVAQMHARLTESYRELKALIEDMSRETKDFNRRVRFNEIDCLEVSLLNLREYVNENIIVNEKESHFLQEKILVYLRYEKENMGMFDPVLATRNELTRSYLKRKESERSSDNIEFLSERLKDSKVGVLEESSSITVLKYQCGYINSLLAEEGLRYFTLLSSKMEKMISDVCYSKLEYLAKTLNTFTALVQS